MTLNAKIKKMIEACRPTAVDFFCGAGGLSEGLTEAGFEVLLASDFWAPAAQTYRQNHPSVPFLEYDIRDISVDTVLEYCGGRVPDVVAGGPPCQGFSSAGARLMDDDRNTLVGYYARLATEIEPEVIVFENVEGFLTSGGGNFVIDLLDPLLDAGYFVRVEKLNVANYGVPQLRKRVIAIASKSKLPRAIKPTHSAHGSPGVWRVGTHLPTTESVAEALSRVVESEKDELSIRRFPTGVDAARMAALKPGETMKDLGPSLQHRSFSRRANRRVADGTPSDRRGGAPIGLRRLKPYEPSKAITSAASREFVHPFENRSLTLREAATIQTFPTNFAFAGTRQQIATMIGNAIPPKFAYALGLAVLETARAESEIPGGGLVEFSVTNAEAMSPALARVVSLVEKRYGKASFSQASLLEI